MKLTAPSGLSGAATAAAEALIPADYLTWYMDAAQTCPGLPWSVLAGIGTVESDNGQSNLPGVHSGANFAGAEGPMQFEPATFAEYATPGPTSRCRPYDPADAIYTAAAMLCAKRRPRRHRVRHRERRLRLQPRRLVRQRGHDPGRASTPSRAAATSPPQRSRSR